jgi:integrase
MKRNAYADSTIKATAKRLKHLQKHCDLTKPEEVKTFIANKNCTNAFKECLIETYDFLIRSLEMEWKKPYYDRYDKLPKIPSEEHINMLISHARGRMALILSISRDLGSRPIEITWLQVKDIDLKTRIVNLTGAKHTIGRNGKLRPKTIEMLKRYINKRHLSQGDRIFPTKSENISESYRKLRNRLAEKLQDPTIKQIRLYDFRHFKASIEYHKTKDLLYVKQLLGHKDLRTTLRYTQLLEIHDDEWTCKIATTKEESVPLIEAGFEYLFTDTDGTKLFRKRK